jgi:hypothetical protein
MALRREMASAREIRISIHNRAPFWATIEAICLQL